MEKENLTIDHISKKLNSSYINKLQYPIGSSAVTIPLVKRDDALHVLFEKRSNNLHFQPGEICFPGGRIEDGESPQDAAMRELCEELFPAGNGKDHIKLLSSMRPMIGPAGSTVFPYVVLLEDYNSSFSEDEVETVFSYSLDELLLSTPSYSTMTRKSIPSDSFPFEMIPDGKDYKWHSQKLDMWFYETNNGIIWGFTARLLHLFLESI
ncbi:NUDIX hydrolase [Butyrivibrio sp. NC2002]|uniref:NUDIX hydrolase n=1 Tax=Butyrivibrio sp. NC2002 TaxID=1410610 RepID=UPI00068AD509|nr:CoA pyrophosphatase [Butyrivibrio sp. NC2002]